jgi:hypothetical protein
MRTGASPHSNRDTGCSSLWRLKSSPRICSKPTGACACLLAIAIFFPIALIIAGFELGRVGIQHSLSAYYWAGFDDPSEQRTIFVGTYFAVGACLIAYRGFSNEENWALNIAGVFAWGAALFPMECTKDMECLHSCAGQGYGLIHGPRSAAAQYYYRCPPRTRDGLGIGPARDGCSRVAPHRQFARGGATSRPLSALGREWPPSYRSYRSWTREDSSASDY